MTPMILDVRANDDINRDYATLPLTENWRINFRRGLIHGPGSRPVNKGLLRFLVDSPAKSGRVKNVESLLRAPPSNLYHSIMRSPSFGLPSPNRITPPDLRARDLRRVYPVSRKGSDPFPLFFFTV